MRGRTKQKIKKIPEALGNRVCGVWPYVLVLVFDAVVHFALFLLYVKSLQSFMRLFFSFVFFIYPLYYVADTFWSLRPSVCDILSGRIQINRKYYMNTRRKEVVNEDFLPLTVSVPVYMENNEIIFETLRESLAAINRYHQFSGAEANILVSDDGLAPMLGGNCDKERIEYLLSALKTEPSGLKRNEKKAAERILFYRKNGISFVVRPQLNRAGLFKKASNLNYSLRLGEAVSKGDSLESLFCDSGDFKGGYAEGDIRTHEIILLLDKDSGVKEKIAEAIVPEFSVDERLAYVQCATNAVNLYENYYTYATGHQINNLFHNIWPCKALQGFFVPLVGHNVFLRKSILEKSGLWPENRVSEDYDRAICFYGMGYHGKYAQIKDLEFTEYASRTFTEETGKQRRYAYGLFEMMFDGTVDLRKIRACDFFYMLLYFCSVVNQVLLLPTVLLESYFGNIHLLWAGFIFCTSCFMFLPLIRGFIMRKRLPKEHSEKPVHTFIVALSFVGHSFSFLAGACRYMANKIKENKRPFPSTNVDRLGYTFRDGIKLLGAYIWKNPYFPILVFLCLDRGIFLLTRKGLEPMTVFTYSYILFCAVLVPVFLTPQLFSGFSRKLSGMKKVEGENMKQENIKQENSKKQSDWKRDREGLSFESKEKKTASSFSDNKDIELFLEVYQKTLQESLPKEEVMERLLLDYTVESCMKKEPDGKKELYLLQDKKTGTKVLLRITRDYPQEDALEEAKLLSKLNHKGIPKVFAAYEQGERKYLVREYVEGRSLYEIINMVGSLGAKDIFRITLKLIDILSYLHAQIPPVIHRDIKPQNVIVGRDGEIYLIDFGIARTHKESREQDTAVVLTLDYASPEQYGFEQTTPLSDIYSLGVLILFMATGGTARTDLEAQIVNNRLRNLIEQCIAFNPKTRIQSVEEIRDYILSDNSQRPIRRKRRMFVAVAVFICLLFVSSLSYGLGFVIKKNRAQRTRYEQGYGIGYTEGYASVPVFHNSETVELGGNGNSYGNLAAETGSFTAQDKEHVFYIAKNGICSMSMNGGNTELWIEKEELNHLSCYNGWLYYSSKDKIMQTNIYTLKTDVLYETSFGKLYIAGEDFYVEKENRLYRLNVLNGKMNEIKEVFNFKSLNITDEAFFFIGKEDSFLYQVRSKEQKREKLIDERCRSVCLFGKNLFCSVYKNEAEELISLDIETGKETRLFEGGVTMLNVTKEGIFFIDEVDGRMKRASFDGRIKERISKNRALDLNISGGWAFYHNKDDEGRLWCVRLDGANDHPVPIRK